MKYLLPLIALAYALSFYGCATSMPKSNGREFLDYGIRAEAGMDREMKRKLDSAVSDDVLLIDIEIENNSVKGTAR